MHIPKHLKMPNKIANYKVLDILGRGGMGVVSKAIDEHNGQFVALKILHTPQVGIFSLLREIDAIKKLDHPGIVKLLDTGVENKSIWYAMEYLDAAPLQGLLFPTTHPASEVGLPPVMSSVGHTKTINLLSARSTAKNISQLQTRIYGRKTVHHTQPNTYQQRRFDSDIEAFLKPKPVFGKDSLALESSDQHPWPHP